MSLSVGRCLWAGMGETEWADCGADDERAGATNLLRRAQFADARVSFIPSVCREWGQYGRVSSMVPNAVSRQEVVVSLGWGQLPSRRGDAEVSRTAECRLGRGRLESHLRALCPQCARTESGRRRVAQGQDPFAQTVCAE